MKNPVIIIFAALLLMFAGCVPKDIDKPITDTADTPDPNTYMPIHKGSTWTYYFYMRGKTDVINNPTEGTKTITMTGDSINRLGIIYHKAISVTNTYTNNTYFSRSGTIYSLLDDDTQTFVPELNDIPCFDESSPAGFRNTLNIKPATGSTDPPLTYINTITTKNLSSGINGLYFDNTISVVNSCKIYTLNQPAQDIDDIYYQFAKGVGLIHMTVYRNNVRMLEISLTKYSIK